VWIIQNRKAVCAQLRRFLFRTGRWLPWGSARTHLSNTLSEDDPRLEDSFDCAARYVANNSHLLPREHLFDFYGLYKQATAGDCPDCPRPEDWSSKWECWRENKGMSRSAAKGSYVTLLRATCPEFELAAETATDFMYKGKSSIMEDPIGSDSESNDALDTQLFGLVTEQPIESFTKTVKDHPEACLLADDRGMTPLHWAADRGAVERIEILLNNGAHINARDDNGETPLHLAVIAGQFKAVEVLLKYGADPNILSNDLESSKQLAQSEKDIASLFSDLKRSD